MRIYPIYQRALYTDKVTYTVHVSSTRTHIYTYIYIYICLFIDMCTLTHTLVHTRSLMLYLFVLHTVMGRKLPEYEAEEEEVLVMFERVTEAQRIANMVSQ